MLHKLFTTEVAINYTAELLGVTWCAVGRPLGSTKVCYLSECTDQREAKIKRAIVSKLIPTMRFNRSQLEELQLLA